MRTPYFSGSQTDLEICIANARQQQGILFRTLLDSIQVREIVQQRWPSFAFYQIASLVWKKTKLYH